MFQVPDRSTFPEWGGARCITTPQLAAEWVAYSVRNAHNLPIEDRWINPDGSNVMILIINFGHDKVTYNNCNPQNPPPSEDATRYFRPEDTLATYQGQGGAHMHPFLRNATTSGELRAWAVAFRDHLTAVRAAMNPPPTDDVNNWKFYMDTEEDLANGGDPPDVQMLEHLHDMTAMWTQWKVPGSEGWVPHSSHLGNPSGQTLSAMYAEMVTATAGTANPWPPGFPDDLVPSQGMHNSFNKPYLIWYLGVCERAREGLMRASLYDVINDPVEGWPGAKCGNYHAANYDGANAVITPTTTWFPDKSLWDGYLDPADDLDWNVPQYLTRDLARKWFSPQPALTLMDRVNVNDRMLTLARRAYGAADSPLLYPMPDLQWGGRPTNGHKGHWGLNPYVPAALQHPALTVFPAWAANDGWDPLKETKFQSRLRVARHMVEAIINSGEGQNQTRLAPWVNQYITVGGDPEGWRRAEREQRSVLAMLRAKAVPEIIFWFTREDFENPATLPHWDDAFTNNADLTRRVWATRIRSTQLLLGNTPTWWALPPLPWHLEFTLRSQAGQDVTVPIVAKANSADVMMQVVVEVPFDYRLGHDFEINLESMGPAGTVGQVMVLNPGTGLFELVPTLEGPQTYGVDNPEFPSGQAFYPVRRSFVLRDGNQYVQFGRDPGGPITQDEFYHLVLRVKQTHLTNGAESRFDLLQVIPVRQLFFPGDPQEGEELAAGDLNADGCVDEADMACFIDGWIEGSAIADVDMNASLNVDDVAEYEQAYSAGGNP